LIPYGQAFQLLQPAATESITLGNTLHTVVQPSNGITADITLTLEPGSVQGQEVVCYGAYSASGSVTIQSNVNTGSPAFVYPDNTVNYSWTVPTNTSVQGIKLIWDGTNWRAQTFGQTIVAPATQNNAAVQLGQVINGTPAVGAQAHSTTATSLTATTATFTAPCNGWAIVFAYGMSSNTGTSSTPITASLAGLIQLAPNNYTAYSAYDSAYLPMTAGQQSTFSYAVSTGTANELAVEVTVLFIPTP
jgi:hypothetical protein